MPDRPVHEQNRDFARDVRFQQHVIFSSNCLNKKVQVGKDQEKAHSEKDSHSKNRDGKKLN